MPLIVNSALVVAMNALTSIRFDRVGWLMVSGDRPTVKHKQGCRYWLGWLLALAVVGGGTPEAIAFGERAEGYASAPYLVSQAVPSSALRLGASGEAVRTLQQDLADLGYYSGTITGYFGEQTEQAVKDFQASNGLTADGVVGAQTLAAIAAAQTPAAPAVATPGSVREGTTGDLVFALQERLAELGYYTGAVDGVFGRGTALAVTNFQERNGLVADGVVGSATEEALRRTDAVRASASSPSQFSSTPSTSNNSSPTVPSTANPSVLRLGSSGREVIVLQSQLQALGYYNGPVDGNFGETTKAAVIQFQTEQGLVGDGLVGPQTTYLLDEQFFALRSPSVAPQAPATVTPTPQPSSTASPPTPSTSAPTAVSPAPPMVFPSATPAPSQVPPAAVSVPTAPAVVPSPQPSFPPASAVVPTAPATTRVSGQGSSTVLAIQQKLQQQGFYSGPLDGVMNPQTEQAILEAQRDRGLSPSDLAQ